MIKRIKRLFMSKKDRLNEIYAEKTAAWWAEKMCKIDNQDNGDLSIDGKFAMAMLNSFAFDAQQDITLYKLTAFKSHLKLYILEKNELWMDVDYHPCGILEEACVCAQIDPVALPIKSRTWVNGEGKLLGRHGYQAPIETIYNPK